MAIWGTPDIDGLLAAGDRDGLARLLESSDPLTALQAAQALARLNDWRGRSFLLTSLEDRDPDVRGAAAELLGDLGDPQAVPGLKRALEDPAEDVRQSAAAALEVIGGAEARQALANYRGEQASVTSPEGWTWPEETGKAFPVGPFPTAEEHLKKADRLQEAQAFAAALVETDLALAQAPGWPDAYNLRGIILEELGREHAAQAAYLKALELEPGFAEAQSNLADLEGRFGPQEADVYVLEMDLQSEDPEVRVMAAAQLGTLGNRQATGDLVRALDDPDRRVVVEAVEALGVLGDAHAGRPLQALHERTWTMEPEEMLSQITRTTPDGERWRLSALVDWHLRAAIIRALGQTGDTPTLLETLRNEFDAFARQDAVLKAAGLPGLENELRQMVEIGAYALAAKGDEKALFKAAEDEEGGQAAALASWALERTG